MVLQVKAMNRTFMMITAPFLGMMIWMLISSQNVTLQWEKMQLADPVSLNEKQALVSAQLDRAKDTAVYTMESVRHISSLYKQTTANMNDIVLSVRTQAERPERIYDCRISAKLGTLQERINSNKLCAELYAVNQPTYSGYAMKVKLKDPQAMRMTLGRDEYGGSETTMQAVKRYNAVAGINAGGYAESHGKRYPLGTTVIKGKYVPTFKPSYKNLSFVGMDIHSRLIGGKFYQKEELDKLQPKYGASFVPALLKNGTSLTIPDKWKTSPARAPRTVIGNYKDDQLLIMVVDGYSENGSSGAGATLEELQQKLANLGIVDAYSLDGGGSSTLIFNGRVINKPSDGELRTLPTHFLFSK